MVPQLLRGIRATATAGPGGRFTPSAPRNAGIACRQVLDQYSPLDIADIAKREKEDPETVAALYFAISERFGVDDLLTQISTSSGPTGGRHWQGPRCVRTCTRHRPV